MNITYIIFDIIIDINLSKPIRRKKIHGIRYKQSPISWLFKLWISPETNTAASWLRSTSSVEWRARGSQAAALNQRASYRGVTEKIGRLWCFRSITLLAFNGKDVWTGAVLRRALCRQLRIHCRRRPACQLLKSTCPSERLSTATG